MSGMWLSSSSSVDTGGGESACGRRMRFGRIPGPWEVRVLKANTAAQRFWARAISLFVGETIPPVRIEKEGTPWEAFFFESKQVT